MISWVAIIPEKDQKMSPNVFPNIDGDYELRVGDTLIATYKSFTHAAQEAGLIKAWQEKNRYRENLREEMV